MRLALFGGVELQRDDGSPVSSLLQQPRRFALLSYLAIEGGRTGVSRDQLLLLFWPDNSVTQGRGALRQSLHFLRGALGAQALVTHGDVVAIDTTSLHCDVIEFSEHLQSGSLEAALAAYRSDLMAGFHFAGCSVGFERWLEDRRAEFRRQAAEAAWTLAERAANEGHTAEAGAHGRTAAGLYRDDEAALRRLLVLLDELGDRAGALREFEVFSRRLAEDYDSPPSDETLRVVERIRSGDASARQGIVHSHDAAEEESAPPRQPLDHPQRDLHRPAQGPPHARRLVRAIVAPALVMAGVISLWGLTRLAPEPPMGAADPTILILDPVADLSPAHLTVAGAGSFSEDLMLRLRGLSGIQVVLGSNGKGLGAIPTASGGGQALRLRTALIAGEDRVQIAATLLDASYDLVIDHLLVDVSPEDFTPEFASASVAEFARRALHRAVEDRRLGTHAPNSASLDALRRAVRHRYQGDSLRRAGRPRQAELAFESAELHLSKAQNLSPEWSEPAVQGAEGALSRMWLFLLPPNQDLLAARLEIDRGIAVLENGSHQEKDARVLELRGLLHHWRWITTPADFHAAAAEDAASAEQDLRAAVAISPTRARAWAALSSLLYADGDFPGAYWAAERAWRTDTYLLDRSNTLVKLFDAALESRDLASARRWCTELGEEFSNLWVRGYCELTLMALDPRWATDADIGETVSRALSSPKNAPAMRGRLEMLAAVVLAKNGQVAAAESALQAAKSNSEDDPELLFLEAWLLHILGNDPGAAGLLAEYVAANPITGPGVVQSWRFRH